jgi:exodeoxyribonuclease VII small subunit
MTKAKVQKPPETFEAALAELEDIVSGMEDGDLPLEQALNAYRRGAELMQYCQAQLKSAQQQVKVLEENTLKNLASDED